MTLVPALLCFLLIFIRVNSASECNGASELSAEAKLRKVLFCNYNKMVRPVKNFENETLVQFQMYPTKISMDVHEEVIAFQGSVLYTWQDIFLKWDPREYEGLEFIRVSRNEIWVPDISVDTWSQYTESLPMTSGADCHVVHMGYVYCFIINTLRAPCTPDVTAYPFDTQNCSLTFSSSGFIGKYINFTLFDPNEGIKMTVYKPNRFWELIQATAERQIKYLSVEEDSTFYPLIKCTFVMRRHSAGHSAIVILPAAVLAGLSLLTFWMDTMYSTRIAVSAVVIFSDILYSIYLGVILPSNGNRIPIIVTFFRDSLMIASFAVVVAIFVRHLRSRTKPPSQWVSDLLSKTESVRLLQLVFLGETFSKEEDSLEIIESCRKTSPEWEKVASFIDRISFLMCCFTYLFLLLFYLP